MRTIAEVHEPRAARGETGSGHRAARSRAARFAPVALVAAVVLALAAAALLVGVPGGGVAGGPVGDASAATPTSRATPAHRMEVGVVGSQDPGAPAQIAGLGAHVMRDEFTPSTTVEELAPLVDRLAARGIRLQPLVGWDDGTPAPDLTAVSRWAAAFGPGGTHWEGKQVDPAVPMTDIELGNENAFYYKSGTPDEDRYHDLATAYGQRAVAAARAVNQANPAVGVLVELESADSKKSTWIDDTLAAGGPDLTRLMHGPTIHPYGPDWRETIDRDAGFLRKHNVTAPFSLTEWGISSDDGPALSDNYDWPVDLTYDQAGGLLTTAVRQMGTDPRIRQLLFYQLGDQRAHDSDTDREHFFGLFRNDGSDKGGYTAAVRTLCRAFP